MMNSRVKAPFPLEAPAYVCSLAERVSGLSGLRAVQALAANAAYRPERVIQGMDTILARLDIECWQSTPRTLVRARITRSPVAATGPCMRNTLDGREITTRRQ